jgi:hypothetical protein
LEANMVAPTAAPAPSPPNLAWAFLLEHLAIVDAILASGHGIDVARHYVWEVRVLAATLSDTPQPDGPQPGTIEAPGKARGPLPAPAGHRRGLVRVDR